MEVKVCSKSVMDNIADPDITFDEEGVSSYYFDYLRRSKLRLFKDNPTHLETIVSNIKKHGRNREYDCLIGISGGVDSTYVAYLVKELGLRPLAIHFDNGWNSELAVKNIEKTLKILNIDLMTYVIDWEEFKSLQIAFLKASTPDGEIPTDHAIFALLFKVASEKGIKYIINGNNFTTEGVMPPTWAYGHIDWKYIRSVNKLFGTKKRLTNYPFLTPAKYFYYTFVKGIRIVSILNYIDYQKEDAMRVIAKKLGWVYYGGKHYESIYTRFFQGYILPTKFKIDKRKAHLSTLVFAGQLSRDMALRELEKPAYPDELLQDDLNYVIKKFNLTEEEFSQIMRTQPKTFQDFPNSHRVLGRLRNILNRLRSKRIMYS